MDAGLFFNSLVVTAAATGIAGVLGLPVAVALRLASPRVRAVLWVATVSVLVLPPFFVAGMWMQVVGFAGAWRVGGADVWSAWVPLVMTAAVLGGMLWPLTALGVAGAADRVDPALVEAHPGLVGWALIRHVWWPPMRGALGPALALTAALAMGNFAVPALFQARVWPEVVWVEFSTRYDTGAAFLLSWPYLLLATGFALVGLVRPWSWPGRRVAAGAGLLRARLGRVGCRMVAGCASGVLLLTLVLPLGLAVRQERMWTELLPALVAARPMLVRSILYAAGSATLVVAGGMLLARWRGGAWLAPLFFLPGIFPGMLLLRAFAEPPWVAWRGTALVVFVALTLRYGFLGWWVAARAWRETDPALQDAARLHGAGVFWRWRHAVWPGARGSLAGLWYAVYALALWDVETLVLIVPPGGDPLALMIFNLLHYGHNPQVSALCVWLGAAALLPLAVLGIARFLAAGRRRYPAGAVSAAALTALALLPGCGSGPGPDSGSVPVPGGPDVAEGSGESVASRLFGSVKVIGGRGTGPGRFLKPRSVAVDASGTLFVVDMTGRVQRFDSEGRWVGMWQMPDTERGRAKGMALAGEGRLWLVEPHYHRVNLLDPQGALLGQWGAHGTNAGQFWFPRAIAPGANGDCFVSEYGVVERVQRFTADGTRLLGVIGGPGTGPGGFNRAEGIGTDRHGNLYVADSCNHRVQVFDPGGRWLRMHGQPGQGPGQFGYPYDVRVDAEGRQFVCEFGNSRVQVFDASDRPEEILGGPGVAAGRMNNPWSLCLDAHGDLYVADSVNHRVQRFVRRRQLAAVAGRD
jgi:ABC-type Fe3+ transport system permease subunit/streptogramin lyase